MPLAPWLVAAVVFSSTLAAAQADTSGQAVEKAANVSPWPCRLIPIAKLRSVIEKGMEQSETIRRQCDELAAARAVVDLNWDAASDSQSHARSQMGVHGGVVTAIVTLPPLGDMVVLLAHELQHVIELTRGLDLAAEAGRPGSGVWKAFGGYETQAAIDVTRQVTRELRDYRKRHRK